MLNNLLLGQTAEEKLYVEDVFSTYLYTGTSAAQTITNGIDLSGKGGLVWLKHRSGTPESGYEGHFLFDTVRGNTVALSTDKTNSNQAGWGNKYFRFQSTGFDFGTGDASYQVYLNKTGASYASWSFRKAAKFFDIVTWTGNATARDISHSLGVSPGLIIIKRTDAVAQWPVWHRSLPANNTLFLNTTDNTQTASGYVTSVSANTFSIGTSGNVNATGGSYIAYLFAHDTTADGVIQCGSFTTDASGNATVTLGWEPQFVLFKASSTTGSWRMYDNMRGIATGGNDAVLYTNLSSAEDTASNAIDLNATGFSVSGQTASATYIYLAIRRGPMRTPTDATKVFSPIKQAGGGFSTTNFPVDLIVTKAPANSLSTVDWFDRLRGVSSKSSISNSLTSTSSAPENTGANTTFDIDNNIGFEDDFYTTADRIYWPFRRAPGFFDIVCYRGTGSARTVSHNLGVAPELMIVKRRSAAADWSVYVSALGNDKYLSLNDTIASSTTSSYWNSTSPTSSVFSTGVVVQTNGSGSTYVAYLFASCPGVSKVGSYTGNGSSLNIDCGFTNGARFVLIKRTDSTGDWFTFDTARGIVAANDPHLSLNTTAAEVTTNDSIDPLSTGFTVNQVAATNVNVNAATYIYLAIA